MKKYRLQIRAPTQKKKSSSRPPLRTASRFGEDEENDVEKEISRQATKTKALKEIEEQHKKALEEDPSAFAYDELYDDTKQDVCVKWVSHNCDTRFIKYSWSSKSIV